MFDAAGGAARAAVPATPAPPRNISPAELVDTCQWVWDTHDSARLSLDAHIDACLARQGVSDEDDATFVRQVVYGLHRFRPFLSSFLGGFFHANR